MRIAKTRQIVAIFCVLALTAMTSKAFATNRYIDSQTGYRITYDGDVSQNVLELLAKKIMDRNPIFKRSHIYRTHKVGANALLVRTAAHEWLVQTDLQRVDEVSGTVLKVWNDVIVYKWGRNIGTLNRLTLTPIEEIGVPALGEGDFTWSSADLGSSLSVQMHWEPHYANLAMETACSFLVGGHKIQHTPQGTFYYSVSADGKISQSSTWDSIVGSILGSFI